MAKKTTKPILRRTCAFLLAFALFLPSLPASAVGEGLGSPAYEWKEQIAPGTFFYDFSLKAPSGEYLQGFAAEYTPNPAVSPVVAYGTGIYGRSDINYVKNYLKSQGKQPVLGINGDFFSLETGVPMGLVINEGRLISSDDHRPAVGFGADGSAFIGWPNLTCGLYMGDSPITIEYVNKKRTSSSAYLLTRDFSEQTRNSTPGYDVFLRITDGASLQIEKPLSVVVDRVEANSTSVPIPEGYMVLTVDANGPPDRVAAVQALVPGQPATIVVHTQDARFEQAAFGVGGDEILLLNGEIQRQSNSAVHPRSAVGVKSDGTLVLFEMDGRQSGYSSGLSLTDTAKALQDMGCVEAINLDGGGSSSFVVKYPGEEEAKVVNSPSDGSLRKCANFIFLVNKTTPAQTAEKLFLYPANYLVLAGSTVSFTPAATDANYNGAAVPAKLSYSVPPGLGTITGAGAFTAAGNAQTGSILVSGGKASGEKAIQIVDNPDEIRLVQAGKSDPISSLTLKTGETLSFEILAFKNKKPLRASPEAFALSVDGEAGTLEGLTFTASDTEGKKGMLTLTYRDIVKTIPIHVGTAPEVVEDFEGDPGNWAVPLEAQAGGSAFYETGYDLTRYGKASLGISYNFETLLPEQRMLSALPAAPGHVGKADYLNLWVYGDGSKNLLSIQFVKGKADLPLDFTGWKRVSLPLEAGDKGNIAALTVLGAEGAALKGTLYIDQITASFGQPLADEAPPVIEVQEPGKEDQSLISARITDPAGATLSAPAITLWQNGEKTGFSYDPYSGFLTAPLSPGLSAGIYKITLEALDPSGNIGRFSLTRTVGEIAGAPLFADMEKHWSRSFAEYIAQRGVVGGVVENGVATFQPERAINRAEFAVMLTRYLGLNPEDFATVETPFTDWENIPPWAENYVKAMYAKGIILGRAVGEGKVIFDPLAPVTRAEAATMLGKTLKKGYFASPAAFKDQKSVPAWSLPYVQTLTALGVISGYEDKSFRPGNPVKRGEVAKMLYSLY